MKSTAFTRCFLILLVVVCTNTLATPPTLAAAQPAPSYAFTVTTTHDTHDAHPGDGKCADKMGRCSLRAAIEEADALPSGSRIRITVPQGTYKLTLGTLKLTETHRISITGASSKATFIKGNHSFGIMFIAPHVSASLSQLTISGGKASYGGIYNSGTLSVSNSTVSDNFAYNGGSGGGIYNYGTLRVSDSTISNNKADYYGGGIDNSGTLSVSSSTISGNSATGGNGAGGGIYNSGKLIVSNSTVSGNAETGYYSAGGGIYNWGTLSVSNSIFSNNSAKASYGAGGGIYNIGGMLTVSDSTLSGNSADYGGGIENEGTASVSDSTLSGNSASSGGGGIYNYYGTATLTGTIVANSPTGGNCGGTISETDGYNLDSDGSCGFSLKTDLNNTDPMLGPLRNNGGPTQTMALLKGSKAIDWVNHLKDCPATDQRGYPRPDDSEVKCDIGAYESAY